MELVFDQAFNTDIDHGKVITIEKFQSEKDKSIGAISKGWSSYPNQSTGENITIPSAGEPNSGPNSHNNSSENRSVTTADYQKKL